MKNGGLIPWNAVPTCGTFKISCLMGRHHMKDALENLLMDQFSRLVHWVEYYPISAKDQPRIHQFGKQVLPGLFLGYALYAGEFGRVTLWLQTLRLWKRWTHRKSTQKDPMQRKQYVPKNGKIIFPVADGRIKLPGGDQDLRTSALIRDHPIRGESNIDFLGESEGSLPQPQDSKR